MKRTRQIISGLMVAVSLLGTGMTASAGMIYGVSTKIKYLSRDKDGNFLVQFAPTASIDSACGDNYNYPFNAGSQDTVNRYKEWVALSMLALSTKADVVVNIYAPDCDIRNLGVSNGL
ncbi:MAG: hypothetical protein HYV03_02345 [Deltaproteobacteria bacterium]|nr:hypothetical protein [Deltaproteobacteria bacterium]